MSGRLIGVVGPSGVGKDSIMQALAESVVELTLARRVITRDPEAGGEDYEPVTEAEFERRRLGGAFCIDWRAHGLSYGIPTVVKTRIGQGDEILVNLSRNVLTEVAAVFPRVTVLNITASPEKLAARLAKRGRETPEEIAKRLARSARELPKGIETHMLSNDGPLDETVARARALLHPVRV